MKRPRSLSSKANLLRVIRQTDLFSKVHSQILDDISADLQHMVLSKGETLLRQGDPSDAMYLVTEGCLQASIKQNRIKVVVGEIRAGEPVGEVEIVTGGNCTATIYAISDTELVKLPKAVFERIVDKAPEVMEYVTGVIRKRLRRNQLWAVLPTLFGKVNKEMLQEIESQSEWIQLKGGEFLFHKGDPGDSIYILVIGRLQAVIEDGIDKMQMAAEISRGEIIGEISMITKENRTAGIYAVRNSEL